MPTTPLLAAARDALTRHTPTAAGDVTARDEALALLAEHGATGMTRVIPEHVTASALVLDPSLTRTLLCFHRKGRFWVQPGGHIDADDVSPLAGALRELQEETGIHRTIGAAAALADVDRHHLSSSFGSCRTHVDLGFAVVADLTEPLAVSAESTDVAWWPVDALPDDAAGGLATRVHRARAALADAVTAS